MRTRRLLRQSPWRGKCEGLWVFLPTCRRLLLLGLAMRSIRLLFRHSDFPPQKKRVAKNERNAQRRMLGEAVVAFPKFRASGRAKIWRQGSAIDKARDQGSLSIRDGGAKWAGGAERVKGTRDVSDDDVRALDQGRKKPWPGCVKCSGAPI